MTGDSSTIVTALVCMYCTETSYHVTGIDEKRKRNEENDRFRNDKLTAFPLIPISIPIPIPIPTSSSTQYRTAEWGRVVSFG